MKTILVINGKGGCGKTTVSTNLASYYASRKLQTAIMDYDPQGSSINWVKSRSAMLPRILSANAAPSHRGGMRSSSMYLPPSTDVLIVDPPAGVAGLLLQDLVKRADFILIPVAPSSIDIHATAHFVRDLLLTGGARRLNVKMGVVANKVRSTMPVYEPLERFLRSLSLPMLTRIGDSDQYLKAVENGVGVFELTDPAASPQRQEFMPIIEWLNIDRRNDTFPDSNIFSMDGTRRMFPRTAGLG